jgi:hypothetical protein
MTQLPDWIAQGLRDDRTVLRLSFEHPHNPRADSVFIDIFLHRITPKNGFTHEDAVMSIIAQMCIPSDKNLALYIAVPNVAPFLKTAFHPDYDIQEGAVSLYVNQKSGSSCAATVTGNTVTLPDGTVLSTRHIRPLEIYDDGPYIPKLHITHPPSYYDQTHSLVAGILSVYANTGYHTAHEQYADSFDTLPRDMCEFIAGEIERHFVSQSSCGIQATYKGEEMGIASYRLMTTSWMFRPDKSWMPRKWITTPKFDEVVQWGHQDLVEAGRLMARYMLNTSITCAQMRSSAIESAHITLAKKKIQKDLTTLFLKTCDPKRLKSQPNKKALKLQS